MGSKWMQKRNTQRLARTHNGDKAMWARLLLQTIDDCHGELDCLEIQALRLGGMTPTDILHFAGQVKILAREWVLDNSLTFRSFRWVCEQLDVDYRAVRRKALG